MGPYIGPCGTPVLLLSKQYKGPSKNKKRIYYHGQRLKVKLFFTQVSGMGDSCFVFT